MGDGRDPMFEPIYGHCECESVRYRVDAPAQELYHCHCSRCRRLHGSLFATYAYILRDHLAIEKGADNLVMYRSALARWHFCGACGCHLLAEHDHNPGVMWYMPATLEGDYTPEHPPGSEKHIFVGSKSVLDTISDELPQYDEYAPSEISITARKTSSDKREDD